MTANIMTPLPAHHTPWLDVCRAMAIMLVLLSHGRHFLVAVFPQAQLLKFGGFLGVEIFFVLSGFLIGRILISQSAKSHSALSWIPRFWMRRWLRTYPNYVLFFFINLGLLSTIRVVPEPEIWHYLTFTQSLLQPHPAFFQEAWSLAIEEIFYFVTPLLMLLAWPFVRGARRALVSVMILLLLYSLVMRCFFVWSDPSLTLNEVRSTALLRLDAIMVGVFAAWCFMRQGLWWHTLCRFSPYGVALLIPTIIITAQPDAVVDNNQALKVGLFFMANLGAMGLIIVGYNWSPCSWFNKMASHLARWSYSAYLANLPLLFTIFHFFPTATQGWIGVVAWFGFMVFTWAVAALVYYSFERNILRIRDHFF